MPRSPTETIWFLTLEELARLFTATRASVRQRIREQGDGQVDREDRLPPFQLPHHTLEALAPPRFST